MSLVRPIELCLVKCLAICVLTILLAALAWRAFFTGHWEGVDTGQSGGVSELIDAGSPRPIGTVPTNEAGKDPSGAVSDSFDATDKSARSMLGALKLRVKVLLWSGRPAAGMKLGAWANKAEVHGSPVYRAVTNDDGLVEFEIGMLDVVYVAPCSQLLRGLGGVMKRAEQRAELVLGAFGTLEVDYVEVSGGALRINCHDDVSHRGVSVMGESGVARLEVPVSRPLDVYVYGQDTFRGKATGPEAQDKVVRVFIRAENRAKIAKFRLRFGSKVLRGWRYSAMIKSLRTVRRGTTDRDGTTSLQGAGEGDVVEFYCCEDEDKLNARNGLFSARYKGTATAIRGLRDVLLQERERILAGRVLGSRQEPLDAVSAQLSGLGSSQKTREDGRFQFYGKDHAFQAKKQKLQFTKLGYVSKTIEVEEGSLGIVVQLERGCTVIVPFVGDANPAKLQCVKMKLTNGAGETFFLRRFEGGYRVFNIPRGAYTLRCLIGRELVETRVGQDLSQPVTRLDPFRPPYIHRVRVLNEEGKYIPRARVGVPWGPKYYVQADGSVVFATRQKTVRIDAEAADYVSQLGVHVEGEAIVKLVRKK